MSGFQVIALLLSVTALTGFANQKIFRLPGSLGMAVSGAAVSGAAFLAGIFSPALEAEAAKLFRAVDFPETVFHGVLCFLLFAGAMHVDLKVLSRWKAAVGILATLGVLLSSLVVAGAAWVLCRLAGLEIGLAWLLVFGALISPTDPIAVLALLKNLNAPKDIETKIAAESLLNDGMGVVLFTIFLGFATRGDVGAGEVALLFAHEAIGGIAFGLVAGFIGHYALKSVDDAPTEVVMTMAYAVGGYALAEAVHVSAPLATAVMGLIIGNGKKSSMTEATRERLLPFWEMFDEGLNMMLFALVGLAMMALPFSSHFVGVAAGAICCALLGRLVSVSLPLRALAWAAPVPKGTLSAMVWGGLRGGLSLAMAMALPEFPHRDSVVTATWAVVIFSLLVQAPTMATLLRRTGMVGAAPTVERG